MKTFAAAAIAAYLLILVSVFAADTVYTANPNKHANIGLETESALLSGDWDTVAQLLDGIDEQSPSPVKRLIKGHACLALNRHDEAVTLIAKTSARGNLKSYHEWATELVGRNNANALAHYFAGDAFARLQNSEKAREAFDRAIALNSSLALAYNARGVVRAKGNDPDGAWDDFEAAIRRNPKLLDAYSNLGVLKFSENAPKGAKEAFAEALSISLDASLPAIGKACCLFSNGQWGEGETQLIGCINNSVLGLLAKRNLYGAKHTQLMEASRRLAALRDRTTAGTTLSFSENSTVQTKPRATGLMASEDNLIISVRGLADDKSTLGVLCEGTIPHVAIIDPTKNLAYEMHGDGVFHNTPLSDFLKGEKAPGFFSLKGSDIRVKDGTGRVLRLRDIPDTEWHQVVTDFRQLASAKEGSSREYRFTKFEGHPTSQHCGDDAFRLFQDSLEKNGYTPQRAEGLSAFLPNKNWIAANITDWMTVDLVGGGQTNPIEVKDRFDRIPNSMAADLGSMASKDRDPPFSQRGWQNIGATSFGQGGPLANVWHRDFTDQMNVDQMADATLAQAERTGASDVTLVHQSGSKELVHEIRDRLADKGLTVHFVQDEALSRTAAVGGSMGWALKNENKAAVALTLQANDTRDAQWAVNITGTRNADHSFSEIRQYHKRTLRSDDLSDGRAEHRIDKITLKQPPGGVIAAVDIYKDVGAWDLIVPYGLAYPTANADVGPEQENNR